MTRLFAGIAAVVLASAIGGTAVWTTLGRGDPCGGGAVAGGDIGGPFELLNASGDTVTDADVMAKPALVYFGYTFCPDVCPFDMARNALAVDILAEEGLEVTPVFITVDPERDTPEIVGAYAEAMHPKATGLTGSAEQVREAARAYKVFYGRGPGEGDEYLMNHSAFTYLMLPEVGFATFFRREASPEEMAAQTACFLRNS